MTDDQSGAYDPAADPVHGSGWNSAARWGGWSWRPPRDGEWFRTCSFCGCIHPQDLVSVLVPQGPCAVCGETGWAAHFEAQQPGWYDAAKARGELATALSAEEIARIDAMPAQHPYDPGGAYATWADMKYGWPHKFYVEHLASREPDRLHVIGSRRHDPDPQRATEHGMTWVRASQIPEGTVSHLGSNDLDGQDVSLGTRATLFAKFYTIHLADPRVDQDVRDRIERASGLRFTFTDDGRVGWERYS